MYRAWWFPRSARAAESTKGNSSNTKSTAFMGHFSSSKWALKSLTIGPQFCEMRTGFWVEAFKNLPRLTRVDDVTIVYRCSLYATVDTERWVYFNSVLSRRDLFPALKSVHVRISCGLFARGPEWATVSISLEGIRRRGVALCTLFKSEWDQRADFLHVTQTFHRPLKIIDLFLLVRAPQLRAPTTQRGSL